MKGEREGGITLSLKLSFPKTPQKVFFFFSDWRELASSWNVEQTEGKTGWDEVWQWRGRGKKWVFKGDWTSPSSTCEGVLVALNNICPGNRGVGGTCIHARSLFSAVIQLQRRHRPVLQTFLSFLSFGLLLFLFLSFLPPVPSISPTANWLWCVVATSEVISYFPPFFSSSSFS